VPTAKNITSINNAKWRRAHYILLDGGGDCPCSSRSPCRGGRGGGVQGSEEPRDEPVLVLPEFGTKNAF
jgi:hypothetical protein